MAETFVTNSYAEINPASKDKSEPGSSRACSELLQDQAKELADVWHTLIFDRFLLPYMRPTICIIRSRCEHSYGYGRGKFLLRRKSEIDRKYEVSERQGMPRYSSRGSPLHAHPFLAALGTTLDIGLQEMADREAHCRFCFDSIHRGPFRALPRVLDSLDCTCSPGRGFPADIIREALNSVPGLKWTHRGRLKWSVLMTGGSLGPSVGSLKVWRAGAAQA